MNERGFFTLIGICFLLVASILVVGIQETSKSYINVARDFKSGVELQNIADSALLKADISKLKDRNINLPHNKNQEVILTETVDKNTNVVVVAESGKYTELVYNRDTKTKEWVTRGTIHFMKKNYPSESIVDEKNKPDEAGVVLISVASRKLDDDTTIYRRSMAYVLTDDNYKTIYFMNSLSDDKEQ